MSVIFQRVIAFFVSVAAILGLHGFDFGESPAEGVVTVTAESLYERYALPEFKGGELNGFFESSGETTVGRYENTTEKDFEDYILALKDAGFSVYDENRIECNRFATLTKEGTAVFVSRFASTKTMRIIAEPKGGMCPLSDSAEGGYDTLLTGMKGETVVAAEGMGFIIRLADGSFCIIDGGMGDPDSVDSDKLMNILLSQKPADAEKPVIAAWIFSHMHGDHIGVFNCFSIDHHDDVELERLYFNFPRDEETRESDSPYMLDDTIYRTTQFRKCLEEYYGDVPVVKLHSGNRFAVRNASFEVLYAYDDLYPLSILNGGMNEDSLLIKMTVDGQSVLWTGDIAFNAMYLVLSEYTKTLKSDILQMPHHGMNGTPLFFSEINPEYALLPVWEGGMKEILARPQNVSLLANPKLRQVIVTSCGTWTIRLPYESAPSLCSRVPDEKTVYPSYPDLLGK